MATTAAEMSVVAELSVAAHTGRLNPHSHDYQVSVSLLRHTEQMQSSSSTSMSTAWCAADPALCTSDESDRSDLPEKEKEGDKAAQSNLPNPIPGVWPAKEEEGDAAAQSPVCPPVWHLATMGDKKYQRSVRKVQTSLVQCLPQFAGMPNGHLSLLARRILAALSPTDRALIE